MPREQIIIGCRLPNGLILTHPVSKKTVTIAGMNTSKVIGATYTTTAVDQEFWDTWKTAYSDYKPLRAGAIFECRSASEAEAKAKELAKGKTGFEPMAKDSDGVKPVTEK